MSTNSSDFMQQTIAQLKPGNLDNAFWQFACQSYAVDEVSQALLLLQDTHAENICFILWLLWLSNDQNTVDSKHLLKMKKIAETFEKNCISPIRQSRIQQKRLSINTTIYTQTKSLELALEQQLIAILYICSSDPDARNNRAQFNAEECLLNSLKQIYCHDQYIAISTKIIAVQQLIRI